MHICTYYVHMYRTSFGGVTFPLDKLWLPLKLWDNVRMLTHICRCTGSSHCLCVNNNHHPQGQFLNEDLNGTMYVCMYVQGLV
jgi:hypothetical protein